MRGRDRGGSHPREPVDAPCPGRTGRSASHRAPGGSGAQRLSGAARLFDGNRQCRRLAPAGPHAQNTPYAQIGTSTTKSFVDATVPVGTAEATYYVVTLRDGQSSEPSEGVPIRFGAVLQGGGPNGQTGQQANGQSGNGQPGSQFGLAA